MSRTEIKMLLLVAVLISISSYVRFFWSLPKILKRKAGMESVGQPISEEEENDQRLVNYLWKHQLILPPSKEPYNLTQPNLDPSKGQGIRELLENMTNGFFVETGTLDGETASSTLYLEQRLNWQGLLVESDPIKFEMIKSKHRKCYLSNTCLSVKSYLQKVKPFPDFNTEPDSEEIGKQNASKVQCIPVFTLLSALNISTVDYFRLDADGSELDILRTIPFDKVFIKIFSVAFEHKPGRKQAILDFLGSNGYKVPDTLTLHTYSANTVILIHENLIEDNITDVDFVHF